jgi:predicted transcriptional regulator
MPPFSFLTNHALTMLVIAHDPTVRMREIAATVGITERAAQRIVSDLVEAGYVDRTRVGRRNEYAINSDAPAGVSIARDLQVGELLGVLVPPAPA